MRLVVTGGRDYRDVDAVEEAFAGLVAGGLTAMAHGGATGLDTLAARVAYQAGVSVTVYFADWGTHGRAAGPIRNRYMLEDFKPDFLLAFPGGRGTKNCAKTAREMGIPVKEIG